MRNTTVQDGCSTDYTEHLAIAAGPVAAGHVLNELHPSHPRQDRCILLLPDEGPVPAPK